MKSTPRLVGLFVCMLMIVIAAGLGPASVVHAATINLTVDTTSDTNDVSFQQCTATANDCSLRGAISLANAHPLTNYVITLSATTYALLLAGGNEDNNATGDLDITGNVSIGGTEGSTIIDGSNLDRVFEIHPGATAAIANLTITGGKTATGGAGTVPSGTGGAGESGGGIKNSGTLSLLSVTVSGNLAGNGGAGGNGDSTSLAGGAGGVGGKGGGIYNGGTLTLTNSTISGNSAGNGGAGGTGAAGNFTSPTGGAAGDGGIGGPGGGIYNSGPLTLTGTTVSGNSSGTGGSGAGGGAGYGGYTGGNGGNGGAGNSGGYGGGIYSKSTMTMTNSTVASNIGGNGGDGGRGGSGGSAVPPATTGSGGKGGNGGSGGNGNEGGNGYGIFSISVFTMTNSTVSGNTGSNGGRGGDGGNGGWGAIPNGDYGSGGNGGSGGAGGTGGRSGSASGILNGGFGTLTGCTVSGNPRGVGNDGGNGGRGGNGAPSPWGWGGNGGTGGAGGSGGNGGYGGVYNSYVLTITDCTISGNTGSSGGTGGTGGTGGNGALGGLSGAGGAGGNGGAGGSGTTGGGIYANNAVHANNITLAYNSSGDRGMGGGGGPGGIDGQWGIQAASGAQGANGAYGNGGGIARISGNFYMYNTLVANNTTSGSGPDCSGTMASEGYNLIRDTTGCTLTGTITGNITGQDPKLSPLATNGGATKNHALGFDSPAIDTGNPAAPGSGGYACDPSDQRGQARLDWRCDIGAYELKAADSSTVKSCDPSVGVHTFGPTMVQLEIVTPGSLSCLTVQRFATNHPNAPARYQTGRYWTITPTGSGYTVNLGLYHTLPDSTHALVGRYTGTGQVWDGGRNSATSNLIFRNGLTELSDWAVGINTPPTVSSFIKTGLKNQTITFSATDFSSHYSDADGDLLTRVKITSLPTNGTLAVSGVPVVLNQEISSASLGHLTFTPTAGWASSTTLSWNGSDGYEYAALGGFVDINIASTVPIYLPLVLR